MERIIDFVTTMTLTSALIGFATGLMMHWLIQKLRYRKPPGPFALPLIGNYKLLNEMFLHKTCLKMVEKYGPIIKLQMGLYVRSTAKVIYGREKLRKKEKPGPYELIMLNDIESVTEALVKRGSDFADRPMTTTFKDFTEGGKDIAFSPYNATWKLHRKIASKALREYMKGDMLQTTIQTSFARVSKLFEEQTGPFDPTEYIDFTVFNVLSHLCYKEVHSFDDPEFKRLMHLENELLHAFVFGTFEDMFPFFKNIFPSGKYKTFMSLGREMQAIFDKKLQKHKKTFDRDNIRDFVDCLLLAREDAEQDGDAELLQKLTEAHLRQTLVDIFLAGIDTSRITLIWAMLYVAAYPDIQAKCQKEIDSVVDNGRHLVLEDKRKLPYTEACLMEIMRLGMAGPVGLPHSALINSQIGGYDIPKGTVVLVNHYALHMDQRHWKNPDKFDPNRYLDESGNLKQKPDSWLPFSAGRRMCLGESIARLELFNIFALFLQNFKISFPEGFVPDFEDYGGATKPTPKPFKIIATRRN